MKLMQENWSTFKAVGILVKYGKHRD